MKLSVSKVNLEYAADFKGPLEVTPRQHCEAWQLNLPYSHSKICYFEQINYNFPMCKHIRLDEIFFCLMDRA